MSESGAPQTEQIDKLFLELSQFTKAVTARELKLQAAADSLFRRCIALEDVIKKADAYLTGISSIAPHSDIHQEMQKLVRGE